MNFQKNKNGFTLIELLVTISIILIIGGVAWVNFRHFGRIFDAERDVVRASQSIRRSLEMTMAMQPFAIPVGCPTVDIRVSYGTRFQVGRTLPPPDNREFYDIMAFIINASSTSPAFGSIVCAIPIEQVILDQGRISAINVFTGTVSTVTSSVDIFFVPPHPRAFIGGIEVHTVGTARRWRSRFDSTEIGILIPTTPSTIRFTRINRAGMIETIRP